MFASLFNLESNTLLLRINRSSALNAPRRSKESVLSWDTIDSSKWHVQLSGCIPPCYTRILMHEQPREPERAEEGTE